MGGRCVGELHPVRCGLHTRAALKLGTGVLKEISHSNGCAAHNHQALVLARHLFDQPSTSSDRSSRAKRLSPNDEVGT